MCDLHVDYTAHQQWTVDYNVNITIGSPIMKISQNLVTSKYAHRFNLINLHA